MQHWNTTKISGSRPAYFNRFFNSLKKSDVRIFEFIADLLGYLCTIKPAIMTSGDLFSLIMNV